MPHCATELPHDLSPRLTATALQVPDTDWHVHRLYGFAAEIGASVLRARYSRYVIDLNRAPDDTDLYPGANGTGLCPTTTFDEEALYREGCEPTAAEIKRRVGDVWQPYHDKLDRELQALKLRFGKVVLLEAHSIRSRVPFLFDGQLPDLNLGTYDGACCDADLQSQAVNCLSNGSKYSLAVNQRFKGGYTTRAYGRPDAGIHALQLELAQSTYMSESFPFDYDVDKANQLVPLLRELTDTLLDWAET